MTAPFRVGWPAPKEVLRGQAAGGVAPAPGGEEFKLYLGRLLKMIPAEVVSLYLVGAGFIPANQGIVFAIWAIVCLVGVAVVRLYGTADPGEGLGPEKGSVVISAIAFVIWVYTLGGPFAVYGLHVPYIGSLLVLAWTFFVPIFYKGDTRS